MDYTKIWAIFAEISEDGKLLLASRVIFAKIIRLPPPQNFLARTPMLLSILSSCYTKFDVTSFKF